MFLTLCQQNVGYGMSTETRKVVTGMTHVKMTGLIDARPLGAHRPPLPYRRRASCEGSRHGRILRTLRHERADRSLPSAKRSVGHTTGRMTQPAWERLVKRQLRLYYRPTEEPEYAGPNSRTPSLGIRVVVAGSSKAIQRISETEGKILEAVAHYRFLTARQLMRLGVTSDKTSPLRQARVPSNHHAVLPSSTSFASGLSQASADWRASIFWPSTARPRSQHMIQRSRGSCIHKSLHAFRSDYEHRVGCVDFHIALRSWAEMAAVRIDFFDAYYDPVPGGGRGRQLHHKTRVAVAGRGVLVPDAVFATVVQSGVKRLYAFELYNGIRTERVMGQLEEYLVAIDQGAIENTYRYPDAVRVLIAFDLPNALPLVCDRASALPAFTRESEQFFLATPAALERDFAAGWQRFDGAAAHPFSQA